ncbi:helix-turn-helix transcriptional regulator [Kitasatospora sp. DSM 101779]|uniref:helix-turn-helix transcriptional regulator n=1 Tax=Kitasatospora sp. DSM 101779 TaxID=2853165 RepID=UPI0029529987|nr:helix-turn-helix transcriptional regulator [Kitasatospora sp. DSM 101779]
MRGALWGRVWPQRRARPHTVRLLQRLSGRAVSAGLPEGARWTVPVPPGRYALPARRKSPHLVGDGATNDGATNAETGSVLFISAGTVKNHLATVRRKPGARTRVGIAAWAWREAPGERHLWRRGARSLAGHDRRALQGYPCSPRPGRFEIAAGHQLGFH